jgi:hypothetical protein
MSHVRQSAKALSPGPHRPTRSAAARRRGRAGWPFLSSSRVPQAAPASGFRPVWRTTAQRGALVQREGRAPGAELRLLGHDVAASTVERYMARRGTPPSPSWRSFLANPTDCPASVDFFVVTTVAFRLLYGLSSSATTDAAWPTSTSRRIRPPVDRPPNQGGLPVRRDTALPDPRPRRRLRRALPRMLGPHGHRGSADRATLALPEPLRRAINRLDSP